jgi:hypothetical protein
MWFFVLALAMLFSDIALSQEQGEVFLDLFKSWPEIGKLVAFIAALQVFMRGLAEALTRIADYTETNWDNKLAAWLSEASWLVGVVLGKIGYGTPKLVVKEEAKNEREKSSNDSGPGSIGAKPS